MNRFIIDISIWIAGLILGLIPALIDEIFVFNEAELITSVFRSLSTNCDFSYAFLTATTILSLTVLVTGSESVKVQKRIVSFIPAFTVVELSGGCMLCFIDVTRAAELPIRISDVAVCNINIITVIFCLCVSITMVLNHPMRQE